VRKVIVPAWNADDGVGRTPELEDKSPIQGAFTPLSKTVPPQQAEHAVSEIANGVVKFLVRHRSENVRLGVQTLCI
jgi:hypothetical protein